METVKILRTDSDKHPRAYTFGPYSLWILRSSVWEFFLVMGVLMFIGHVFDNVWVDMARVAGWTLPIGLTSRRLGLVNLHCPEAAHLVGRLPRWAAGGCVVAG